MLRLPRAALLTPLLTALLLTPAAAQTTASPLPAELHCPAPPATQQTFTHPADPTDRLLDEGFRKVVWERVKSLLQNDYADPNLNGLNWAELMAEFEPRIAAVKNDAEFYAALRELTDRFEDDHTAFLSPQEAVADETARLAASTLVGVGVLLRNSGSPEHVLLVEQVVPGRPADRAGVRRGDALVEIEGEACQPFTRLRGAAGSEVKVGVWRADVGAVAVTITRAPVTFDRSPVVQFLPFAPDTLLVTIPTLYVRGASRTLGELLERAARETQPAGIIIDMRGNRGGLNTESDRVLGMFTDQTIGYVVPRTGIKRTMDPVPSDLLEKLRDVPLVVLVDPGSKSASEVIAGGLQGIDRAKVIGAKTSGFAGGWRQYAQIDGSVLFVRTETLLFANDDPLKDGVTPDVLVDVRWPAPSLEADPAIREALRVLSEQRGK